MFTEEEIRAIELYFKYSKKLALVVREPGYPSKRNLRRWIRSWEAGGGVKESIRHKPRYSDVQKQVAVEHYLNHGCCLAFTSRTLGYPYRRRIFRHSLFLTHHGIQHIKKLRNEVSGASRRYYLKNIPVIFR